MFWVGSGVGGWGYTCVNISLKCSVSVHEIFIGKRGHLTVIKLKKELKFIDKFFFYVQFSSFNDTFCEKIPEFRNLSCRNAMSVLDLKHSFILNKIGQFFKIKIPSKLIFN